MRLGKDIQVKEIPENFYSYFSPRVLFPGNMISWGKI